MPARRFYRRRRPNYRRKRVGFKKRRFTKAPIRRVFRNVIPNSRYTCLTWSAESVQLNGSTTLQNIGYRLTGAFDPSVTTNAAQPRYWQQMAALYRSYQVFAVKIRVIANNTSVTPCNLGIYWTSNSEYVPNSWSEYMQGRHTRSKAIKNTSGGGLSYITSFMKLKHLYGRKLTNDPNFCGSTASAGGSDYNILPITDGRVYVGWIPMNYLASSPTSTAVNLQIRIKYYVRFFDPTDVDDSVGAGNPDDQDYPDHTDVPMT